MTRLLAALIVVVVIASFVIGWGIPALQLRTAPAVVAAVAAQEGARADRLRAAADIAQSSAVVTRQSIPASVEFNTWLYRYVGVAVAIVLIGSSLAAIAFLNVRARVIYPNAAGQFPILVERRLSGQLVALDLSRGLGPLTVVEYGGQVWFAQPSGDAIALQLATQAQAASVLMGVAAASGNVAHVSKSVDQLQLPAPTFDSSRSDNLRLVYVKQPGNSEASRDLSDLAEFIRGVDVRGLARRSWADFVFASGHSCTRVRYDGLVERLRRAGVISPAGQSWRLAVTAQEALDAFGVGPADGQGGDVDL